MMLSKSLFLLLLSWATLTVLIHGIVPPKTPVLSGFEPAAIGKYRELVCDASQPDAGTITYKWYKYSKDKGVENWETRGPIGTSQKYIFSTVSEKKVFYQGIYANAESVSGKYKCRASNLARTVDSDWGDLYVYTTCPHDTVSVSPAKPAIGSSFTVKCYIHNPSGLTVFMTKQPDSSSHPQPVASASNSKGCLNLLTTERYSWSSCRPPSQTKTFDLQVTNAQTSDSAYWFCKDIQLGCIGDPVKILVQAQPGTPNIRDFPTGPVAVGTQVNLACVASPPGDTYDWYKDNTKLTTSLSYDFQVKKESAGVYKCVAKNEVGSATSINKTLIVYSKADSVVVSSGKTSCHAGETDRFTCTATGGYPTPTLTIYIKRSRETPVEVIQDQDRAMAKEDNQAEYYCEAKVVGFPSLNMKPPPKTYNVTFPNTKVSFINNPAAVQVGQVKKFTCETDESNPVTSIKWYQSVGGSFQDVSTGITSSETNGAFGGKIRVSEWSVTATKAMNGQNVRCTSTYSLTGHIVTTSAYSSMSVKFNPSKITMIQKPGTAIHKGQLITIVCETDSANPAAAIQFHRKRTVGNWMEQTSGITSEDRNAPKYNGMITKSTLTETANRLDNQAVFECKVEDGIFQVTQMTTVTVYYPPTVKLSSNPKPVKEGENLTLTCVASGGNPTAYTYSWYYNSLKQSQTTRGYIITRIKYTQSGIYKCEAVNYSPGGNAHAITDIDVLYKAKWNPAKPELFTVASKTNEPVLFVLHVIANPLPAKVTWSYQNGTVIQKSFTAFKVNDTTYTLNKTSVTIKDYGNYTVNVANQVGVSTFVFELQRAGPPYPPCCLKMINTTAVSVYLNFKSNFSGGSDQTFTIEQSPEGSRRKRSAWVKAAEKIPDPGFEKDVFHKVKGLTNGTTYQFRVKAVNADGSSDYNVPGNGNFLKVTTKAAPIVNLVVGRKDDSVIVSWSLERVYSKIRIQYCPVKGGGPCSHRDVESPAKQGSTKFDENKEQIYKYSLVVFDGDDKVFSSLPIEPPPRPPNSALIGGGAAAGILLLLIIIAVIVAVVFIKKRRADKGNGKLVTSSNTEEGTVNTGFNNDVDDGMNPYADSFEMAASSSSTIQVEGAPGATYAVVNKGNKKPLLGGKGKKKDATPSGSQAYAEVDFSKKKKGKGKKKPETGEAGAAYAEVDFSKKKKGAAPSTPNGPDGAVYAQVNKKPPVGDEYAQVDFTKKASKKEAAPDTPGDVYAVVNKPMKPDKLSEPGTSDDQAVYANVNGMAEGNVDGMAEDAVYEDVRDDALIKEGYKQPKTAYQVGVDGTIYSEVRIKPPKNPDVIIGKETIEDPYGSVDFTKEAPSLPEPEDPDDPNDPGFMILL